MSTDVTTPDADHLDPRFISVTPAKLGGTRRPPEDQATRVLTPAYPGFKMKIKALNADPTPDRSSRSPAVVERVESVVRELDAPPILMGHSAGGVFTQQLIDGAGAAGVAINCGCH